MSVKVSCPGCGGPVEFKVGSSMVTVCPYCRSVVARGDRNVEDLGKVAALADTDSPLEVGLQGKYEGQKFYITGRAQLGHEAGGIWDEWYASFPNDQWGWLAEAQGRFYLTFPEDSAPAQKLASYPELQVGQSFRLRDGIVLRVAEKGQAKMVSAEGEIPYRLEPGQTYTYADLSGPKATFGTIDYSDEQPQVFFGREVTLDDLGVPKKARRRESKEVAGRQLSCPQCGAALALRAPDRSERVTCPSCAALLDINQGELRFLEALKPGAVEPLVPLGTVATLPEGPLTTIGLVQRCVTYAGVNYYWEEYLLYEPRLGFRWLVNSDGHWSYVKPIAPGDVGGSGTYRYFENQKFRRFQKADAVVTYVAGEFYWKVQIGEVVQATDYIHPPLMLSREYSTTASGEEINWSLGNYMPVAEVEQACTVTGLPRPSGVAPNQPFGLKSVYKTWAVLSLVAFVLVLLVVAFSSNRVVFERTYTLQQLESTDKTQVIFTDPATDPIELKGRRNIEIAVQADVNNAWLAVEGNLVNEETWEVQPFSIPLEYYHGVEDGESWTEGSRSGTMFVSALPAGKYALRLEIAGEPKKQPHSLKVRIVQGVPRWLHIFLLFLFIALVPLLVLLYQLNFEYRRWQESEYSPFQSSE